MEKRQYLQFINEGYGFEFYLNLVGFVADFNGSYPTEREFKTILEENGVAYTAIRRHKLKQMYPEMFAKQHQGHEDAKQYQFDLDHQELGVQRVYYAYSQPELVDEQGATCLTTTTPTFVTRQPRYRLFDNSGQYYLFDVPQDQFEQQLNALPTEVLDFEQPHVAGILMLIEQVKQLGYTVVGYHLSHIESYPVVEPALLTALINHQQETHQPTFEPINDLLNIKTDYRSLLCYDDQLKIPVFNKESSQQFGRDDNLYFKIRDAAGQVVFDRLTLDILGTILFCVGQQLPLEQIQAAFLTDPKASFKAGEDYFMYDRLACSAEVPIETLTDIKKVALCSVDTTQTISEYWRWSPRDLMRYGKAIAPADFGQPAPAAALMLAFNQQLTNALRRILKQSAWQVRKATRQFLVLEDVVNVDLALEDSQSEEALSAAQQIYASQMKTAAETRYDLLVDGQCVLQEVPLDELLPAIMEFANE